MARPILDAIGGTPLVEVPLLRPEGGARVLMKLEGANPTGSMKDRMALSMVEGALRTGELPFGGPVVERTGGSTGSSLAMVCAVLGHPLSIVTADCFSIEKIRTMRALGADVEVQETPAGKMYPGLIEHMDERVKAIVEETGAYWTNQFRNPHHLAGYDGLAAEILADAPDVTDFVHVVGTAGSAMGVSTGLKARGSQARVTLVEPAESPYMTDGRGGEHHVEGVAATARPALLDDALYDAALAVPEAEGRAMARRLAREAGLLVGTSSGLNAAAARRVAAERGPDDVVVTLAVDTGLKYLAGDLYGGPDSHAPPGTPAPS